MHILESPLNSASAMEPIALYYLSLSKVLVGPHLISLANQVMIINNMYVLKLDYLTSFL